MFEKVNPAHPDKIADRIAGALVDMAYKLTESPPVSYWKTSNPKDAVYPAVSYWRMNNPKIAVEVLIGHGECYIIAETSVNLPIEEVENVVYRIAGDVTIDYVEVPQDKFLAENQTGGVRCGDNGIFKGAPITKEQRLLTSIAQYLYHLYPYDGKYILDDDKIIICQSNIEKKGFLELTAGGLLVRTMFSRLTINPLGDWTGGTDVDAGATNRKLGSDMGDSVTGGGLHGKDLSKADVSVNIYAWLKAQATGKPVEISCAIGDETVDGRPYEEIVEIAQKFINKIGGFEKFAEWGYPFNATFEELQEFKELIK